MLFNFNLFVSQSFDLGKFDIISRCFVKIELFLAVFCHHFVDIVVSFEASFSSLNVPPLLMSRVSNNSYTSFCIVIFICLLIVCLKSFFPTLAKFYFFNLGVRSVCSNICYILELVASLWNLTVNHFLVSDEPSFNKSKSNHALTSWISHFSVRAIQWHCLSACNKKGHIFVWFDYVLVNSFSNQFQSLFHRSDWLPHQIVIPFQFSVIRNSVKVVVLSQRLIFAIKNAINFLQLFFPRGLCIILHVEFGIFLAHQWT